MNGMPTRITINDKAFTRRCGICYRNVDTDMGRLSHQVFDDLSVRCYAEPSRAKPDYISGFAIPVAAQHDRRKIILPVLENSLNVNQEYAGSLMMALREVPDGYEKADHISWDFRWCLLDGNVWLYLTAHYHDRQESFWAAWLSEKEPPMMVGSLADIENGMPEVNHG